MNEFESVYPSATEDSSFITNDKINEPMPPDSETTPLVAKFTPQVAKISPPIAKFTPSVPKITHFPFKIESRPAAAGENASRSSNFRESQPTTTTRFEDFFCRLTNNKINEPPPQPVPKTLRLPFQFESRPAAANPQPAGSSTPIYTEKLIEIEESYENSENTSSPIRSSVDFLKAPIYPAGNLNFRFETSQCSLNCFFLFLENYYHTSLYYQPPPPPEVLPSVPVSWLQQRQAAHGIFFKMNLNLNLNIIYFLCCF